MIWGRVPHQPSGECVLEHVVKASKDIQENTIKSNASDSLLSVLLVGLSA